MTRVSQLTVVGGLVAILAISAACAATTINQVMADPSRYRDREVTVSGTVSNSFSALTRGIYLVKDDTGELWVYSDRGVPRNGARVTVKGTIREGFNLGSFGNMVNLPPGVASGLILVESSRNAKQ